jgi:hydroxymethylglutaryl-CoA synthase
MEKAGLKPADFRYAVFHQPNGKFPQKVGKMLGFTAEQFTQGLLCPKIGNTYSGSSPLGLTAILDVAQAGDHILMVSYGSGAGSDGFVWEVTDRIDAVRDKTEKTWDIINRDKIYLDYGLYSKYRKKIIMNE